MSSTIETYGRDNLLKAALGVDPDRFKKLFDFSKVKFNITKMKVYNSRVLALCARSMENGFPYKVMSPGRSKMELFS